MKLLGVPFFISFIFISLFYILSRASEMGSVAVTQG